VRILHVQRAKGIGGSERHLLALLPALAASAVDVRMCVLTAPGGDQFVDAMRAGGVDTARLPAGPDLNPATFARLLSEIRTFRPDIVHTHLVHADVHGQLAAAAARVAGISSVHDTSAFWHKEPYRSAGRLVGRLARRRIAISEHVADFLRRTGLGRPDRIRVVHYGIDATALQHDAKSSRPDLGLMLGDFTVGIASRLVAGKGHDVLIPAIARAAAELGTVKLLVAGDGPERGRLEMMADRYCSPGTVRFLGFVPDIGPFMHACDVLAFPTLAELSEGFGLAALEAMAAGRPVIASAVGSLPEVVDDGVTGVLVPPSSVDALGTAIVNLARDPVLRERLGANGAARARRDFPLDKMVRGTIDVYVGALESEGLSS
jgi:glycosyltransferase involved in cell wall biosynthesis